MKKNSNLHEAKRVKNDEFYTRFEDVNDEMNHYKDHFKGKVVYCNCDSAKSNFWLYFRIKFDFLGLKKLVATHYDETGRAYKLEYEGGLGKYHPDMGEEGLYTSKEYLEGDGDFRSSECLEILAQSDMVVTNPPFSLFREFVDTVLGFEKEMLVVGSMNAITYKNVFGHIKNNKLWLGITPIKVFLQPDGSTKSFGNICWFTNLAHSKRNEEIILYKSYVGEEYPTYDNYEAIEVSKVKDIPVDYNGSMGVPITFLTKYNPDQFEIVRFRKGDDGKDLRFITESGCTKEPYFRIVIKKK